MNHLRSKGTVNSLAPLIALLCCLCAKSILAEDAITYGVQPFIPPIYLDKVYGPLVHELSEYLHKPVYFRTRRTLDEYRDAIRNEEFDIILVNPFEFQELRHLSAYRGLLQKNDPLMAAFFAIDADIDSLEKLRGKILGFPPKDMAVTILGLQALAEAGLDPDQYRARYFSDHLSCKQALASNRVDVCVSSLKFAIRCSSSPRGSCL